MDDAVKGQIIATSVDALFKFGLPAMVNLVNSFQKMEASGEGVSVEAIKALKGNLDAEEYFKTNQTCPEGYCRDSQGNCVPCTTIISCPDGKCCPTGYCLKDGKCVPCEVDEVQGNCPPGYCLVGGKCLPCSVEPVCPPGYCVVNGVCAPCEILPTCPEGYCLKDGKCVPCDTAGNVVVPG